MYHNKAAIRQLLRVALGEILCVALMLTVYSAIGKWSVPVLWGAAFGCAAAILYFASISITVSRAADRAQTTGETAKARFSVQASSSVRLFAVALVYIIMLKVDLCDPLAALLPLLFLQVSINVTEYFRKNGGDEP